MEIIAGLGHQIAGTAATISRIDSDVRVSSALGKVRHMSGLDQPAKRGEEPEDTAIRDRIPPSFWASSSNPGCSARE